jgi:methylated-DNA-[protein]-cysteine S-methyltransferase
VADLVQRLHSFFRGAREGFADVPLDVEDWTPFQRAVAETLRQVAWGEVVSYGELAAAAGYRRAGRAVGTFCARNRYFLLVPCHRVVAAGGIGSYGSLGVSYKRRLLRLEGHAAL